MYYYDGTLQCFAGQHLPYGVTAIIVLVMFLIPFPIYVFAVIFNLIKVSEIYLILNLHCLAESWSSERCDKFWS